MPINPSIPLQIERPRFATPADMLSLQDLQTRAHANEFNLQNAQQMAPLQMEQLKQQTESGRLKSLADLAKLDKDKQDEEDSETLRMANALVSAPPQSRPGIWKAVRSEGIRRGYKNIDQYPEEWNEGMLPGFQAFVSGQLKPEQAIEQGQYGQGPAGQQTPQPPQAPQIPLSQIPHFTGPQAIKLKPYSDENFAAAQSLPAQEAQFQDQLAATGQATAPPVGVSAKKVKTPDDWRAYADRQDAIGTKVSFERAKEARVEANRLEQRLTDQEKLEDARAGRGDAAKTREQAQKFKMIDVENKLRDDFLKGSKVFVDTKDAYTRIQDSASDPSAAGDLALIFNYMKMLDPGSTVREGEFATAQDSAGVPERVRNYYNRLLSGERLGEVQRKDFVGRADKLYQGMLKNHESMEKQYKTIATKAGVDPKNVIIDLRTTKQIGAAPKTEAAETWEEGDYMYRKLPDGTVQRKKK